MSDVLSLRVPTATKKRLDKLSRTTARPASVYVREALEAHLDRLEYEYGILKKVEDFRAGKLETITLDELEESLGLADSSR
jgi:RHH-type rel operon transcriptional repressor/antitoxin RelB